MAVYDMYIYNYQIYSNTYTDIVFHIKDQTLPSREPPQN
jgi:hypothetical protein